MATGPAQTAHSHTGNRPEARGSAHRLRPFEGLQTANPTRCNRPEAVASLANTVPGGTLTEDRHLSAALSQDGQVRLDHSTKQN